MNQFFKNTLKCLAVVLVILLPFEVRYNWQFSSSVYWSVIGLDGESTAYDYLSSSIDKRLHFTSTMCDDGVCLHAIDWRCGFTIDSLQFESEVHSSWNEAVDRCFSKLTKVVPMYTALDKVRKICGRHYMQFDPPSGVTEQDCSKSSGIWGAKKKLYLDEEELLSAAKIEE